jgi:hypothetical protein
VANSKLLVNQWRNEPSSRDQLGHHLAFTKSAQEPEKGLCSEDTPLFSIAFLQRVMFISKAAPTSRRLAPHG